MKGGHFSLYLSNDLETFQLQLTQASRIKLDTIKTKI